jgi:predicted kinase
MIEDRFASAKLAVIDMGTGQGKNRKHIVKLAKKQHCFAVAIVLNVLESEEKKV